jgi:2-succinyl-6-hydroxy-2,4-cyclohexadiene-1-carboxylate synthase
MGPSREDPRPVRRIWLHGFLGCPEDWDPLRRELGAGPGPAPAGELAPWLPGHGPSPTAVPDSLDAWVDRLLEEVGGTDPLELVGYSLGGRLALRLALRLPERVRRLVLLGASPGLESPAQRAQRMQIDRERAAQLTTRGLTEFIEDWYRQPLFQSFRERPEAAGWLERRAQGQAAALAAALVAASPGAQASLWPRLPELPMPVLWLAGERDAVYAASSLRAAARCPRGTWALVPGAGHAAQLEEPGATAERIRAFLDADSDHSNQGDGQ